VTESSQARARSPFGGGVSRLSLIAAVLAAALIAVGLVLALGGGSHERGAARAAAKVQVVKITPLEHAQKHTAEGDALPTITGDVKSDSHTVVEVADPEEANSFPAPANVQHKAAKTPAKASEAVVAAGAPSDAEVKQELEQMHAVERSAKEQQQQRLKPVAGGNSVGGDGTIPIPPNVPEAVQRVIAGGNAIADFPYVFGGGHASFVDNAYDCSGSVSYALAAGGLLSAPQTSGELEHWGAPGPGRYITIEAAAGHVYMYVDGVMFNTAGRSGVYASRWQVKPVDNSGYVTRHWPGL
jgi:cell wall-associated NlpC family hydrolase